jgi:TPR repeat protein
MQLGLLYESGQGVQQDFAEAMRWYRKAAEQKEPHATCRIADLYRDGKGVERNLDEAAKWYQREANGTCRGAQVNLGLIFEAQHNMPEALKWYRRAAEGGETSAQAKLGDILSDGFTVPSDYVEACQWLILAVEKEENLVLEVDLRRVKAKLTPEQLEQAQERANAVTLRLKAKEQGQK